MDVHDPEGVVRLARMIEAGSHEPSRIRMLGNQTASRVERLIDFAEQARRLLRTLPEDGTHTV
jgi:hypothetical protein